MKKTPVTNQDILTRQVAEILPNKKSLEGRMEKGRIRLYLGVDPTGKNLHLGHMIPLRKLQQFAALGHEAILLVGTGTVLAGDPSQRATARTQIAQKEISENIKTWKKQAAKAIDFSKVEIRQNGDWLSKLRLPEILNMASNVSASQLFQRDMFQARLKRGDTVWTHELLYPLLQGYDSVHMDVDLEIGGTDQVFNMLVGRELQKKMRKKEKYVLTVPMLIGLDGKQMSKSSGNTINVLDPPGEMYGKVLSLKDNLISHYFELCTDVSLGEIKGLTSRDAKAKLARVIVAIYHGEKAAEQAENEFERVFKRKEVPTIMPIVKLSRTTIQLDELLITVKLASSKSEARRIIEQKGIKIDGEAEQDPKKTIHPKNGMVIQRGKREFRKIA